MDVMKICLVQLDFSKPPQYLETMIQLGLGWFRIMNMWEDEALEQVKFVSEPWVREFDPDPTGVDTIVALHRAEIECLFIYRYEWMV